MQYEPLIRLTSFFSIFFLMALWEVVAPLRPLTTSKPKRWIANLILVFLNTFVARLLFSTSAVGMAYVAGRNGWGILNLLDWPKWLTVIVAMITLDLTLYLQH